MSRRPRLAGPRTWDRMVGLWSLHLHKGVKLTSRIKEVS
jgi:hypothetical protein